MKVMMNKKMMTMMTMKMMMMKMVIIEAKLVLSLNNHLKVDLIASMKSLVVVLLRLYIKVLIMKQVEK
jgi:hypothetical protein